MAGLKLGAFFFGGVEMSDAGGGPPDPMDRRYSNQECWQATLDYVEFGARLQPLFEVADNNSQAHPFVVEVLAELHARWQQILGLRGDERRVTSVDSGCTTSADTWTAAICSLS